MVEKGADMGEIHKKIKAIIVDDSALMRQLIREILTQDPEIEVVATASDPYDAREKIKLHNPDVMTLDIEMPRMTGLEFLEKVMSLRPMPVVMVSTLTQKGADITLQCLRRGAVDYVSKPTLDLERGMKGLQDELIQKVKVASKAKVRGQLQTPKPSPSLVALKKVSKVGLIAIGSSTGGVQALEVLLSELPEGIPPIVITQHMPPVFTASFAKRLDELCSLKIQEAEEGMVLKNGNVYIAPGGFHLGIMKNGSSLMCRLEDGPLVSGNKPSVDFLFQSVVDLLEKNQISTVIGLILTGMGSDGAIGLKKIRESGGTTLGQDEASSLVYGMPRAAMEIGGVEHQLPLQKIAEKILELL